MMAKPKKTKKMIRCSECRVFFTPQDDETLCPECLADQMAFDELQAQLDDDKENEP
jgi:Zn finger protein HypA/HybF involved in hydrogenase expression